MTVISSAEDLPEVGRTDIPVIPPSTIAKKSAFEPSTATSTGTGWSFTRVDPEKLRC